MDRDSELKTKMASCFFLTMLFSLFGQVYSSTVELFHHLFSIRLDFLSIEPRKTCSHFSGNGIAVLEFFYLSHAFLLFCSLTVTLDASSSDAMLRNGFSTTNAVVSWLYHRFIDF